MSLCRTAEEQHQHEDAEHEQHQDEGQQRGQHEGQDQQEGDEQESQQTGELGALGGGSTPLTKT